MTVAVEFKLNETVTTEDPVVDVRFPASEPGVPGVYDFQLVVVDDAGVQSAPVTLRITVRGDAVARIVALDANEREVAPPVFRPGDRILLSAKASTSENGEIRRFNWRLTARPRT
jgi:antitoxin (DNA-binding transcriptional repressor) of toxin-antitoxin stability system